MSGSDTTRPFSADQLNAALTEVGGSARADYLDDIVARAARTRQRPAWTYLERWLPMTLTTTRSSTAPPLRAAWTFLLIGLLTAALVASLIIAGSLLLRDEGPDSLNGGVLVPTLQLDETWDTTTIPGLSQPSGLDVGPDGNLYVVNAGASEILVLSPDGDVLRRWGERGAGEGQFYFERDSQVPTSTVGGVAVAPDGDVLVSDTVNDRVQRFDSAGAFIGQFGGFGPEDGRFLSPFDVAVDSDGSILVVDDVRGDIQRFDPDGDYQGTIGSPGTADGQMNDTSAIAIGSDGAVYNADYANDRLQSFGSDGTFRWSVGRSPGDAVALTLPGDVGVDSDGYIYVTEGGRLIVLTPERALASVWELPEGAKVEEWLPIAVADDGTVYLSAEFNGLIYKLRNVKGEQTSVPAASPIAVSTASEPPTSVASSPAPMVPAGLVVGPPFAVPFSADQPAGWKVTWLDPPGGVALNTEVGAEVRVFVPTNAYADPCHPEDGPMSPPVGPSVDDLVAVLTSYAGIPVTSPVRDVMIDGYHGKTFDLESTLPMSECGGQNWDPMWTYDSDGVEKFAGPGQNFHQRIAVLDVNGVRVLIETWTFDDTRPQVVADAFEVVDSIDFE